MMSAGTSWLRQSVGAEAQSPDKGMNTRIPARIIVPEEGMDADGVTLFIQLLQDTTAAPVPYRYDRKNTLPTRDER
jgi:hypothetical protein